jgi:hypothetical protein
MSEVCQITLPIDPNLTSPNRARNWRTSALLKRKAFEAARLAWIEAGRPTSVSPIIAHYHVRRYRRMDDDNIIAGMKAARDGLFNNAITPDDSSAWVTTGLVTQETGEAWRFKSEVVVTVETLE